MRPHASRVMGTYLVTMACCKMKLKRKIRTSSHRAGVSLNKCTRGSLEGKYRLLDGLRPLFYGVIRAT